MKNFKEHWKALADCKEEVKETPRITKNLTIIHWSKSFKNYLIRIIGARIVLLIYIITCITIDKARLYHKNSQNQKPY